MSQNSEMKVEGYRPQSDENVAVVNEIKRFEERMLRVLDFLATKPEFDKRWLALGRTHLEQGFMAVNRSIFRPDRISLPEDGEA